MFSLKIYAFLLFLHLLYCNNLHFYVWAFHSEKVLKLQHTTCFHPGKKSMTLRVHFDYDLRWCQAAWEAVHQDDTKGNVPLGLTLLWDPSQRIAFVIEQSNNWSLFCPIKIWHFYMKEERQNANRVWWPWGAKHTKCFISVTVSQLLKDYIVNL